MVAEKDQLTRHDLNLETLREVGRGRQAAHGSWKSGRSSCSSLAIGKPIANEAAASN